MLRKCSAKDCHCSNFASSLKLQSSCNTFQSSYLTGLKNVGARYGVPQPTKTQSSHTNCTTLQKVVLFQQSSMLLLDSVFLPPLTSNRVPRVFEVFLVCWNFPGSFFDCQPVFTVRWKMNVLCVFYFYSPSFPPFFSFSHPFLNTVSDISPRAECFLFLSLSI